MANTAPEQAGGFASQHLSMIFKYIGISFVAGAVSHGVFSGSRSLLTAGVGVIMFMIGQLIEYRRTGDGNGIWQSLLIGAVLAIGMGFFTGSLQHFPDSPDRSLWVVPVGFAMTLVALMWMNKEKMSGAIKRYAVASFVLVGAISLGAHQYFKANPFTDGHGGHSHGEVANAAPAPDAHDHAAHDHGADMVAATVVAPVKEVAAAVIPTATATKVAVTNTTQDQNTPSSAETSASPAEPAHDHATHDHSAEPVAATTAPVKAATTEQAAHDHSTHDHGTEPVAATAPAKASTKEAAAHDHSTHDHGTKPAAATTPAKADTKASAGHDHSTHDHGKQPTVIGKPGDLKKVDRVVTVTMNDKMRYEPSAVTIKEGETIRFMVENKGTVKHELTLGDAASLKEHAAQMLKTPDMQHNDPNLVSLEPGAKGEIIWQFTKAGTVDFACLQPGHFEAGMRGAVTVKTAKKNS
ncbi:cupredoxin domain-containing protein [Thiofilum flexile]|uniref:cupredoxin domain-containing protein n=1 Tax=Thiofilum flexile TaxID=125627 RepID=UPI00037E5999|nr:cupredoxin family protein [Thiofilum flexile]